VVIAGDDGWLVVVVIQNTGMAKTNETRAHVMGYPYCAAILVVAVDNDDDDGTKKGESNVPALDI